MNNLRSRLTQLHPTAILLGASAVVILASALAANWQKIETSRQENIQTTALIEQEAGIVELTNKDNEWTTLDGSTRLSEGGFVKTADKARASIVLPANNIVRLSDNATAQISRLNINKDTKDITTTLRELKGTVWVHATESYEPGSIIGVETYNTRLTTTNATLHIEAHDNTSTIIRVVDGTANLFLIERNKENINTVIATEIESGNQVTVTNEHIANKTLPEIVDIEAGFEGNGWRKWNTLKDKIADDAIVARQPEGDNPYFLDSNRRGTSTRDILGAVDQYSNMTDTKLEAYLRTSEANTQNLKIENDEELEKFMTIIRETKDEAINNGQSEQEFWSRAMVGISTLKTKDKLEDELIKQVIKELTKVEQSQS